MVTRRGVFRGLLATGLMPRALWADVASPAFLSAAQAPDGSYRLYGLDGAGKILFSQPLPDRGHAGVAHPTRAQAVAFARRPGRFAFVLDCGSGQLTGELHAPEGRHFYGHGAYSADGHILYTTENDYEAGQGVIGVWDARAGYRRVSEFASGGVGPHEMVRLPGRDVFVIANGGIETHPEAGRMKLNLATMRPSLSYVSGAGELLETVEPDAQWHQNSIRHLSVRRDGLVAFGMQWQGDRAALPRLVGFHRMGGTLEMAQVPDKALAGMNGYIGSVVFSADGVQVAVSSPRGGLVQVFDSGARRFIRDFHASDVCGISRAGDGFVLSCGTGDIVTLRGDQLVTQRHPLIRWDNHLVPIS